MKVIGITQRLATQESYQERREILALDWGKFFSKREILPIPLSYEIGIENYSLLLDGVILSGGNDLSFFSSDINSLLRDKYESEVIEFCVKNHLPLLGVCRGAQMIAHYFDSSLEKCEGHIGEHSISWSNGESERVNSFHHYKIVLLGAELEYEAVSEDRGVEAFSHRSLPIYGIMWHPEREKKMTFSTKKILDQFLKDRT